MIGNNLAYMGLLKGAKAKYEKGMGIRKITRYTLIGMVAASFTILWYYFVIYLVYKLVTFLLIGG